jgi:hypothetical protein
VHRGHGACPARGFTAARATRFIPVLEVGDAGRLDGPDLLEPGHRRRSVRTMFGPSRRPPFSRDFSTACALVHLAALLAVGLVQGGQRKDPAVELLAAFAEWVLPHFGVRRTVARGLSCGRNGVGTNRLELWRESS